MDKKGFRAQIEAKLETALAEFSDGESEKKFKKHIKKATKILVEGLVFPVEKPEPKLEEAVQTTPGKKVNGKKTLEVKGEKIVKKAPVKKAKNAKATAKKSKPVEKATE
jgi:hypothetical protein